MSNRLGDYILEQIVTGDARQLCEGIPDESVDLILTDPVYQNLDDYEFLGQIAAKLLRPGGSLVAFAAHHRLISCGAKLLQWLDECPVLSHRILGPRGRLFPWSTVNNVMPALWFARGHPNSGWQALLIDTYIVRGQRGHKWGKNRGMLRYRIARMTQARGIVLDPFCGGASTGCAAKELGRHFLGFEIDPETAEQGRQHYRDTQETILTVPLMEQLDLAGSLALAGDAVTAWEKRRERGNK